MSPEKILVGLAVVGVALGCLAVLYPFISAMLWAAILVFTSWPVHEWVRAHLRLGRTGTALAMVASTAIVLVLPIVLAAPSGHEDIVQLRVAIEAALKGGLPAAPPWLFEIALVGPTLAGFWDHWAADIGALLEALRPYLGTILENGLSLLLGIANGVAMFLLALFVAFFFYLNGETLGARLRSILIRVAGARADRLIAVTSATIRGVVYGIAGTAVVQGIMTAFGLWLAGVPRPLMLGVVAGMLSVLPVGAPAIWIPASLWLMGTGHVAWGIFLAIYGGVGISGADSIIRPWFIARGAHLPFLLTILGVLGGVLTFGLLGVFVGPVLLGMGHTLMQEWLARDDAAPGSGPSAGSGQ